ncbi:MAG: hypothetical protein JWM81_1082 [Candidatus Saccharibacteria bacterium]|nr:hypothetical protein [Candidatus Saccharibacteria bacterium]
MLANTLLLDAFDRIKTVVHTTVDGLSTDQLSQLPNDSANSIAWLVWHLTRIQDDHIADLVHEDQIWKEWYKQFALPFEEYETGYGQTAEDVASVQASAELLLGYYDAVHAATINYLSTLTEEAYQRIVDKNWDPPVTLAVRLISVISDDLQHAGQAAYVRGLLT